VDKLLKRILRLALTLSIIIIIGVSSIAYADPGQPGSGETTQYDETAPIEEDESGSDKDKEKDKDKDKDKSGDDESEGDNLN
jgi:hypothetical protein